MTPARSDAIVIGPASSAPRSRPVDERQGLQVAVPLARICETAIAGKAMAELITTGSSATPLDAF